jgi:hypothetical protein
MCLAVCLQAQKEIPADFASCKDKFLVQVKGLEAGEVRVAHRMQRVHSIIIMLPVKP